MTYVHVAGLRFVKRNLEFRITGHLDLVNSKYYKNNVSETGSVSVLRWGGGGGQTPILLGPLEIVNLAQWLMLALSKGSFWVGVSLPSLEGGNKSSFRNVVFSSTLYPQKLAITSPTSGGRSVGIVRSRTQTMEVGCLFVFVFSSVWNSDRWTESRNPVILGVIHHCQNPSESASILPDKFRIFYSALASFPKIGIYDILPACLWPPPAPFWMLEPVFL
jgi:hypothetical protein